MIARYKRITILIPIVAFVLQYSIGFLRLEQYDLGMSVIHTGELRMPTI
jgi:hypothetical protein